MVSTTTGDAMIWCVSRWMRTTMAAKPAAMAPSWVDVLTLDRSFLPSQDSAAIAAAVAQVASALGLDVVAEGVATAA
jgi:EAL domain-containing protein (putative c-di-GMP-specific phosphodiesterase class I)